MTPRHDEADAQQRRRCAVLGLSFDYHDAAAALLVDGRIVAAAQEERFTRSKHDAALPVQAIRFCLEQAGVGAGDLDAIVHYENPFLKFDRIVWASQTRHPGSEDYLRKTTKSWIRHRKFDVPERIRETLDVPAERIHTVGHHQAHAASAFYCSPFDEAVIITLDGVGEYETASIGIGRGTRMETVASVRLPHSLGLFYSAMTAYLGFEVNEGEYKVMGMAAFGEPKHHEAFRRLFQVAPDGTFEVAQELFEFLVPERAMFTERLTDWLGPPRMPEAPFLEIAGPGPASDFTACRNYADIAASVQRCTEDVIMEIVDRAVSSTGIRNVCMAGGVALNSLANGRLRRERNYGLYVQPSAGDAGGAIGAAALHHHVALGQARSEPLTHCYLGRSFGRDDVDKAIADSGYSEVRRFSDQRELIDHVATLLAGGAVVGWCQGRAEWGPRALGCRSILADPRRPDMKGIVNEKIKFREPFRPFAPAVPLAHAHEYFDMPPVTRPTDPEHLMLAVHPVLPQARRLIPAVTHADGTGRVQVVSPETNPLFHSLLIAFGARTGVPVLLNTSFNLRGEPIVDTPRDALKTFSLSGMEYLVLGDAVVSREFAL